MITNSKDNITLSGSYAASLSDHNFIVAFRKIGIRRGTPRYVDTRSFKNFDETKFVLDLQNTIWPIPDITENISDARVTWKSILLNIVDKHAPCRMKRIRNKPSPWINPDIKREMYARDLLKKKAIKSNSPFDWLSFKTKKNMVNKLVKKLKKSYQSEIKNNFGNPKGTWKVLNDLMGRNRNNTEITKLNITSSESVTDSKNIANSFNTYFTEIGPKLASEIPSQVNNKSPEDFLTKVDSKFGFRKIKSTEVFELLKGSKTGKAVRIDKISNKILKIAAPYIVESLTNLFNLSIQANLFPNDWKLAKVTPIFKSGDRCDANNYRPISVISAVARIFEKLIYIQLEKYITEHNLINL